MTWADKSLRRVHGWLLLGGMFVGGPGGAGRRCGAGGGRFTGFGRGGIGLIWPGRHACPRSLPVQPDMG